MSRPRLVLKEHLSLQELEKRYRSSSEGIERSHWQILWLYAQYNDADKVASVVAYSPVWVRELVKRYNQHGVSAVGDLRCNNPGGQYVLDEKQLGELESALSQEAADGGLWTGPKVAQWIAAKTGCKVSAVTGWKYLLRLNQSLQVPRPKHEDSASEQEREAFKKTAERGKAAQAATP
jgi:transposase